MDPFMKCSSQLNGQILHQQQTLKKQKQNKTWKHVISA